MQHIFLYLFLTIIVFKTQSQQVQNPDYPKTYFSRPLAIPVSLAGNFGDLRSNHYHMGLDFRTRQRENLPVMASAEGYVSRIKIEPYGYGRAIYITHPNGYITIYAHLNGFYSNLETYVRLKQYADKSWKQDVELPPGLFKVYKGQFIAYSGNTGGSEGPHLHFEIRDAKTGSNLNPLLFGLGIADDISPTIYRLALYNRNKSIYESAAAIVKINKQHVSKNIKGNRYVSADSVVKVPFGKFSLGISAEDRMSGSFLFGIYGAALYLDSVLQLVFRLDDFTYDDSRYINAGIDYPARKGGSAFTQHLSRLPGNRLPVYYDSPGDGLLQLHDDSVHKVLVTVNDVMNNQSELRLLIQRDSTFLFKESYAIPAPVTLEPGKAFIFSNDSVQIILNENAIYDTVYFRYSQKQGNWPLVSAIHQVSDDHVPVHDSFTVRIKINENMTEGEKAQTVMVLHSGNKYAAQKGKWDGNQVEAKWWDFGDFMLCSDSTKPVIIPVNLYDSAVFIKDRQLVIKAWDETGSLQSFNGFIDDQWVIFKQKNNVYTYEFDDRCNLGWHRIKLVASDVAGNTTTYSCNFHNGRISEVNSVVTGD